MLSNVYGAWIRTESLTTIWVSAQRVGSLNFELAVVSEHQNRDWRAASSDILPGCKTSVCLRS